MKKCIYVGFVSLILNLLLNIGRIEPGVSYKICVTERRNVVFVSTK